MRLLPSLRFPSLILRGSPRIGNLLIGNLMPMRLMPQSRSVSALILRTFMPLFAPPSMRLRLSLTRISARLSL